MRQKRMSEERRKLDGGPVPRSVRPSSRVLDGERAEAPCGLLVNKLGSRQAGARRLKVRSNPRAEVRGAKRWPGSILGQRRARHTGGQKPFVCLLRPSPPWSNRDWIFEEW